MTEFRVRKKDEPRSKQYIGFHKSKRNFENPRKFFEKA